MQVNKDFRFRDDLVKNAKDTVPIELLNDPFNGIVYRYDTVTIKEEDTGARLQWTYTFLNLMDFDEEKLRANGVFEKTMGNILNAMILEQVDSEQYTSGSGDTEEPSKERGVLS